MKLRNILIVLSLLSFLSVSVAGYLYYSSLQESAFQEAEKEIALQAERTRNSLSSFLSENRKTVKALAGLDELERALEKPEGDSLKRANLLLDNFQDALKADVCYLMDGKGTTIASSNRNADDSFVGRNFSFRPYWQEAILGAPATYMAHGVASNVRGVYYSHPVAGDAGKPPIGVVVIKAPMTRIEEEFRQPFEGIVLLADPRGIIFASNRKDWLYRSLWKLSGEDVLEIARTRQFGAGPWDWTGIEIGDGDTATDAEGRKFLLYRMELESYPGWNVIYLRDYRDISGKLSGPMLNVAGSVVPALCLLIGLSVFIVYKRASDDIKNARDQMRRLSDSILASQEKERATVSRELHDELGQVLTALHLDAAWLRERLKEADREASQRARAMYDMIDKAIEEVRGMATRLRPGVLDDLGLVDALDWHIGDFEKRSNLACSFRHAGVPKVDERVATTAYRIAQEALTNVARHSGASRIDVFLRAERGELLLSVEDDGMGFDMGDLSKSKGLGIVGMRERAELIGGMLEVRSNPGGGARVLLRIPLGWKAEARH